MSVNEILIPSEFARLLDDDWREAAVWGGRGSLKSHTVARILLIKTMTERKRVLCGREYQNSINDSVYQLLLDLIYFYKLPFRATKDAIICTTTGSNFLFKGLHNNIQSIKSLEAIDYVWIEEAQTITANSLETLTPTIRKAGSKLIYTFNRLQDKDPIYKRLVIDGRPNKLLINVNYPVAIKYGWMSDVLLAEMEDDRERRPEIFKHKWLGEPASKEGRIFSWKKIESVPAEAEYKGNGLDFGYTNDPTAIINVFKWNNAYILDEICYARGLKNPEIAQLLVSNTEKYGPQMTTAESAEPKSIDEIKDNGHNYIESAVKGKDSVNNGIQRLQELEIYYTENSHNIEEEVLNYSWKVDKEDKSLNIPIDAYNHAIDAIRYRITSIETFKITEYGGVR